MSNSELIKITDLFKINGEFQSVIGYGSGHINKTYLSTWKEEGGLRRYIHQCINDKVFPEVERLMSNISTVLDHIGNRITEKDNYEKINLIPSKNGKLFANDGVGRYWRTYNYIENTEYIETCSTAEQAREAGRITGFFQNLLIDLDVKKLNENIRKFTSAPHRLQQFVEALDNKPPRMAEAIKEIDFAEGHGALIGLIESKLKAKEIPRRIVHGDTKINNVLFSKETRRAVCLVDLDTCMPGYSLYDFGDLARSISINAAEDEQDFSKIQFNRSFFESLLQGYLLNAKSFLNKVEIENMHLVPQLIALTLGMRFLTDYLNSDIYFNVKHDSHNLERARTQFKVFEAFKSNEDEMKKLVKANVS
jgi:Ser/Thr protein kinase RdoA (MazF antagonist)